MRELTPAEQRKRNQGLCITKFCRKPAKAGIHCHACHRRLWAEKNPLRYCFCNLRGNARRRKKDFTLTFEQFCYKVTGTDYLNPERRGTTKYCLSIDRRFNEYGYHCWNIRVITISLNSSKRNYVDYGQHDEVPVPF